MINSTTVKLVYSGRPGCACGCRGTYWSASNHTRPGSKVSDRQVTRITTKVNEALNDLNGQEKNDRWRKWEITGTFVAVSNGKRDFVVYFTE